MSADNTMPSMKRDEDMKGCNVTEEITIYAANMTLEDHFAGLIMAALLGNEKAMIDVVSKGMTAQSFAYKAASLMMSERNK